MHKDNKKVLGSLLGVAIGDALGGPLEFMTAEEIQAQHGTVREMIGGGWLNLAPGEITDDTQMTLCVAEGIVKNPQYPFVEIGKKFVEWYDSNPKDIGNCCRAVIANAKSQEYDALNCWLNSASLYHKQTGGAECRERRTHEGNIPGIVLWYRAFRKLASVKNVHAIKCQ